MIARSPVASAKSIHIRQLLVVGASLVLLATTLFASAGRPSQVDATFGLILRQFRITTIPAQVAGVGFTVRVEAVDAFGLRVVGYSGADAVLSGLGTSPNGTAPVYGSKSWSGGIGTYTGVKAHLATGSASITVRDAPRNVSKTSNTFAVARGPLTLSFTAQPLDAEISTAIESSWANGVHPVTVLAADAYGNPYAGTNVTASTSTALGGTTTRAAAANGVASFDDLTIATIGIYTLTATAAGPVTTGSQPFQIVTDLAVCDGGSCAGGATFTGNNKQTTFSSVQTGDDFDNRVALTTSFLGDGATVAKCLGSAGIVGQVTEVRVTGSGVSTTQPDFKVAIIVPKSTLQALGLSSRNAESFEVCLGAIRLDGGTAGWTGKVTADDPIAASTDVDGVHWGWMANCSAVTDGSPCISLKTKNAGQLQAELGMSNAEFRALGFQSSDLALVGRKEFPWDGKFGFK